MARQSKNKNNKSKKTELKNDLKNLKNIKSFKQINERSTKKYNDDSFNNENLKSIILTNKKTNSSQIDNLSKKDLENEFRYLEKTFKNDKKIDDTLLLIKSLINTDQKEPVIKISLNILERCSIEVSIEIIKILIQQKYYIPLSLKLISILKESVINNKVNNKVSKTNKLIDNSYINDHQIVDNSIIKEILALLFAHLNSISNSPSFPDIAFYVIKELEKINLNDNFEVKNDFKEILKRLKKHSKYVEEIRKIKEVGDNEIQMMVPPV
ncbi:hypothetical protein DMUE_2221 [Dictyocoela muelleri]|nr:hypothetical protein DMUE_2221 [Dictyocoela muelleri]